MANIEIRNTSNEVVTTIEDGTIDSAKTSINLFGKGTESYLKEINENFYALLENFSATTAPTNPVVGQVWYAKKGTNLVEVKGTGYNYQRGTSGNHRYLTVTIGSTKNTVAIKQRRGIALVIFDDSYIAGGSIKSIGYYDTYGSNAARTQLARKLGTVGGNQMFVMTSFDAIGTNTELNKRMDKLKSQAWHKIKSRNRYPYTAIGTGKFGIISEDLKGYAEKIHSFSQLAFTKLTAASGMGTHTNLTHVVNSNGTITIQSKNDNLLVWNGDTWALSATNIDGKDLAALRSYILSGVDLSVKFDTTGGTVNGSVVLANELQPKQDVIPTGNEIQDLGSPTKKYKELHLSSDKSIYMGPGKEFNKNSFVYTVEKETDSVVNVPAGSLILNRATGEAIVKKSNFKSSTTNNTFRKLSQDSKYAAVIGGNNYNFKGEKGIWMGSWRHGRIQQVTISTPANATLFGNMRWGGHSAGCSDATRGLSFHQHNYSGIQYMTISTPMNAVNFGRFYGGWSGAAASDGTRAVVFGGRRHYSISHYVLFATPMNSVKNGDLGTTAHWNAAVSDGSKAIFDRGRMGWNSQQYRYVTISTPANAIYFGKMQNTRGWCGATSNGVHGLWAGGWNSGAKNTIERLTLVTPSNSTHFGNLTYSRHTSDPVSNDSKMVAAGGNSYSKTMDTISYANGGSATNFGNAAYGIRYSAYFSGN